MLVQGKYLAPRPPTTKISLDTMNYDVAYVLANSHYRPGKTRNCMVHGSLLKNLPLHLRYSSVGVLYINYTKSLTQSATTKIGYNSFRTIVAALTRTGAFNQGLSYYYVDRIDNMLQLRDATKSGRYVLFVGDN
jgi:hypothetical protein